MLSSSENSMIARFLLLLPICLLTACQPGNSAGGNGGGTTTNANGVTDYNPDADPRPLGSLIQVDGIGPGARLVSPFNLTGKADVSWYFEGDFPVKLVDTSGNVLAQVPAKMQEYGIERGFVPFKAALLFIAGPEQPARLQFILDNPSATEGIHRTLEIPVILQ